MNTGVRATNLSTENPTSHEIMGVLGRIWSFGVPIDFDFSKGFAVHPMNTGLRAVYVMIRNLSSCDIMGVLGLIWTFGVPFDIKNVPNGTNCAYKLPPSQEWPGLIR